MQNLNRFNEFQDEKQGNEGSYDYPKNPPPIAINFDSNPIYNNYNPNQNQLPNFYNNQPMNYNYNYNNNQNMNNMNNINIPYNNNQPVYMSDQLDLSDSYKELNLDSNIPISILCPSCHSIMTTRVKKHSGCGTFLTSCLILVITGGTCCLCFAPYFIDDCKDTIHYCTICASRVGTKSFLF